MSRAIEPGTAGTKRGNPTSRRDSFCVAYQIGPAGQVQTGSTRRSAATRCPEGASSGSDESVGACVLSLAGACEPAGITRSYAASAAMPKQTVRGRWAEASHPQ